MYAQLENPYHSHGVRYGLESRTDPRCPECGQQGVINDRYSDLCADCLHEKVCDTLERLEKGQPVDASDATEAISWAARIVAEHGEHIEKELAK